MWQGMRSWEVVRHQNNYLYGKTKGKGGNYSWVLNSLEVRARKEPDDPFADPSHVSPLNILEKQDELEQTSSALSTGLPLYWDTYLIIWMPRLQWWRTRWHQVLPFPWPPDQTPRTSPCPRSCRRQVRWGPWWWAPGLAWCHGPWWPLFPPAWTPLVWCARFWSAWRTRQPPTAPAGGPGRQGSHSFCVIGVTAKVNWWKRFYGSLSGCFWNSCSEWGSPF